MSIPLVTTQDNFEVVRDKICEILAAQTALQQYLAEEADEDPNEWKFYVTKERYNPIENWMNDPVDKTPIVNVWFDSDSYREARSNNSTRQVFAGNFNIDVYCYETASETISGHIEGDQASTEKAHKLGRYIRRIIMHPDNIKLGLEDVWSRKIVSRNTFQPNSGNQPIQHIVGIRLVLEVEYNETIDLTTPEIIEHINITLQHEVDGLVRAEINIYDGE